MKLLLFTCSIVFFLSCVSETENVPNSEFGFDLYISPVPNSMPFQSSIDILDRPSVQRIFSPNFVTFRNVNFNPHSTLEIIRIAYKTRIDSIFITRAQEFDIGRFNDGKAKARFKIEKIVHTNRFLSRVTNSPTTNLEIIEMYANPM